MGVLDAHCAAVGRDPREITRTRLGTLVGRGDAREGRAAAASWPDRANVDAGAAPQASSRSATPDEVGERVRALVDAGLDGLVFHMPNPWDLDAVALAGETLTRAFA